MADDLSLMPQALFHSLREVKQSIWYRIGSLHDDMNDLDAALSAFEKVLGVNPNHSAARAKAGILLMKKECYRDAISSLHSAVSMNPDNPPAWVALAYSYVMSDDLDNGYQAYHTVMSKMPHHNDPTLWFGIGVMYDRLGLLDHALDAFLTVLEMAPHFEASDKVCYDIGLIYKEQHKYEHAHKFMSKVLAAKARQPLAYAEALYQIGHIHELAGSSGAAMEAYHGSLTRNPNHLKALQALGWLNFEVGQPDEAVRLLGHASQVEPTDALTFYLIGRMAMANNDYHKAYDNYQHAVYRDGKNADFWCAIGILYFHMRQYNDAMDAYNRATRVNPELPEVWFDMATLYEVHNQPTDAVDAYRRVLRFRPSDSQAAQRLSYLEHALSNRINLSAPAPMPRSNGPVVSPNPASAARPHIRSDVAERIGALPSPPRVPSAPQSHPAQLQTHPAARPRNDRLENVPMREAIRPVETVASDPLPSHPRVIPNAFRREELKNGVLRAPNIAGISHLSVNGSANNAIMSDSTSYPMSTQQKVHANGEFNGMARKEPAGYPPLSDKRIPIAGPQPISNPEVSPHRGALYRPPSSGAIHHRDLPNGSRVSRPLETMAPLNKVPFHIDGPRSMPMPSEPRSTRSHPIPASDLNGVHSESLNQSRTSGLPAFHAAAPGKHELWGSDIRQNVYRGDHYTRADNSPTRPVITQGEPVQPSDGLRRAEEDPRGRRGSPERIHSRNTPLGEGHYAERNDAPRGQVHSSSMSNTRESGVIPSQSRPSDTTANPSNPMTSEERSRLSASSSYEKKLPLTDGYVKPLHDTRRNSGEGSVRSSENEVRHGSPASRNSRRSLPGSGGVKLNIIGDQSQGRNITSVRRESPTVDEAMLPRLRPLPDPKVARADENHGRLLHQEARDRSMSSGLPRESVNGNMRYEKDSGIARHGISDGRLQAGSAQHEGRSPRSSPIPQDRNSVPEETGQSKLTERPLQREDEYRSTHGQMEGVNSKHTSADGLEPASMKPDSSSYRLSQDRMREDSRRYPGYSPIPSHDVRDNVRSSGTPSRRDGESDERHRPTSTSPGRYGDNRLSHMGKDDGDKMNSDKNLERNGNPFPRSIIDPPAEKEDRRHESDRGLNNLNAVKDSVTHSVGRSSIKTLPSPLDDRNSTNNGRSSFDEERNPAEAHFGSGAPTSFSKSLSRGGAANGIGLTSGIGKEIKSLPGKAERGFDRAPSPYENTVLNSDEAPNANMSPRGSKRKILDYNSARDERERRPDGRPYETGFRDTAMDSDGKNSSLNLAKPKNALFSRVNARPIGEPGSSVQKETEDPGRSQKRIRSNGISEETIPARVSGADLKSRD